MDLAFTLNALLYSGLLSLLGLAVVLRYRASGIPDFSVATYLGLGVLVTASTAVSGMYLYLGPVFAFAIGCLVGWAYYRGVLGIMERRGDGEVMRTLSTVGIMILGDALLYVGAYALDPAQSTSLMIFHTLSQYDFVFLGIRGIFYVIPAVCIGVYAALHLVWRRTRFGATLTASQENPDLAAVQGVDPWRVRALVWTLTGGLACAAGSLFPPFLHLTPGYTSTLLSPILAVGLLGGFFSLALTIAAAYIVGFVELFGTYGGQLAFGTWFGEYRPLISMAFIYFGLLLLPKGLQQLRESLRNVQSSLRRNRESAVKVAAFVLIVVGLSALVVNNHLNALAYEKAGWVDVANRIGVAGAIIYSDGADPRLLESQYFQNAYPTNVYAIRTVGEFSSAVKSNGVRVVYLHDGSLYAFVNHGLGFVYNPQNDNYGR